MLDNAMNHIYPLVFPLDKKKKKGIYRFGMKGQGNLGFVQRCVEDGQGWYQIARSIGWIAFAAMKEYTSITLADFLSENELLIDSCNRPPFFGYALYYPATSEINLNHKKSDVYGSNAFEMSVICAQFISFNKERFKDGAIKAPNIYLVNDAPAKNMFFHALMQNGNETVQVIEDQYDKCISCIYDLQLAGFSLESPVYFDMINIPDSEKAHVNEQTSAKDIELFSTKI